MRRFALRFAMPWTVPSWQAGRLGCSTQTNSIIDVPSRLHPLGASQLPCIAMPPELTEEQRLRRNAKSLAQYHATKDAWSERRRQKGQKKPTTAQNTEKKRRFRARHPEKVAAQRRVENRVRYGKWPRVKIFKCSDCDAQAQSYHTKTTACGGALSRYATSATANDIGKTRKRKEALLGLDSQKRFDA